MEMNNTDDAMAVYNYFQSNSLTILGNKVEVRFSRYDKLTKQEDQSAPQRVLLVSIICYDKSTLSLRHFYSVPLSALHHA